MKRPISRLTDRQAGFTLMELMVVIVIIGILVTIVGGRLIGNVDEARRLQAKTKVDKVRDAIRIYKLRRMEFPNALEDLLQPDDRNYGDPYIEDETDLVDPWGEPLEYKVEGRKIEIISYGADKGPGGTDYDADISSAQPLDKPQDQ